jgi:DnaJ-class molecular chaperone
MKHSIINYVILCNLMKCINGGRDFYKILNVSRGASDVEIKKSYRQLAKVYHPDRNSDNDKDAHDKFTDLAAAYEVLFIDY